MLFKPKRPPAEAEAPLPKLSSQRWRDDLIPQLETKLAEARAREIPLKTEGEIAELTLALGLEGAEEEVVKRREQRRLLSIEIEGLEGALRRAKAEQTGAENEEKQQEAERRVDALKKLGKRRVELAGQLDAWLRQGNALAHEYLTVGVSVGNYRGLNLPVQVPADHRLRSGELIKRAIGNGGEALIVLLDAGVVPAHQRQPLAGNEYAAWRGVMAYETAADRERAEITKCQEEVEAERPDLLIDANKEYPEGELERLSDEFDRLVAEKRRAKTEQG